MAETECRSGHVVVDIEGEVEEPSCVVCTEPMGWVAVFPCGHREVCVRCAATIRFFHNDLRCCICRAHCSTVFVTKANTASGGQRGFPSFLWPPPPASFASQLLVGHYYLYHRGMAAYFDDVHQYQEMEEVCTTSTSPSSQESRARYPDALLPQPASSANVNLNVSVPPRQAEGAPLELEDEPSCSSELGPSSLVCIAVLVSLLAIGGFFMVDEHPFPQVLIVVPVSVLFSAFTAGMVYAWRKFRNNNRDE